MKKTRLIMGMPVTLEVAEQHRSERDLDAVFAYFEAVDEIFSTYKPTSEISRINAHTLSLEDACEDMRDIFQLAEQTRMETHGYFNIARNGFYDPSGIVKGWAIQNAASLLWMKGFSNFYVDAGGDIQTYGLSPEGGTWRVGIRNPFNVHEIVKVLAVTNQAVATSGTSIRGQHIYNPNQPEQTLDACVSLTVIGPNILDADRYATAAFAMGTMGIEFIEALDGFEGYQIDATGRATLTSGIKEYVYHG